MAKHLIMLTVPGRPQPKGRPRLGAGHGGGGRNGDQRVEPGRVLVRYGERGEGSPDGAAVTVGSMKRRARIRKEPRDQVWAPCRPSSLPGGFNRPPILCLRRGQIPSVGKDVVCDAPEPEKSGSTVGYERAGSSESTDTVERAANVGKCRTRMGRAGDAESATQDERAVAPASTGKRERAAP